MDSHITLNLNVTFNNIQPSLPIPSPRIINGYKVEISNVPYHATIHRYSAVAWWYLCGAVIIHEKASLTAAHCIDQGGDKYGVSKVIKHQHHNHNHHQADIAFMVHIKKINFNKRVSSIPHAPKKYIVADGTEATVTGFGSTLAHLSHYSGVLRTATVYITNRDICAEAYITFSYIMNITNRIICASATDPLRDACFGDSGGPLVANGYLIGIVSSGIGCAHPEYPGIYTSVSFYNKWIKKNLKELTTRQ